MKNTRKEYLKKQKQERIGMEKYNNDGELMKVIDYINSHNVIVEFQDECQRQKSVYWKSFVDGKVRNPIIYERLGLKKYNKQGCEMEIIQYNTRHDIIVEFNDGRNTRVHSIWKNFDSGIIENPYYPSVYGVGITGQKYPTSIKGKLVKEYQTWTTMLKRCYDKTEKELHPTYKDVTCCEKWLLYENFYEWLHSQENFEKWKNMRRSAIDKDILTKGNKIYSPDTCCLVPSNVNSLFVKRDKERGDLPIGVIFYKPYNNYRASCTTDGGCKHLKYCDTPEEAFYVYKEYKENLIKQIAQEEYAEGNITKKCYDAMMNYKVEITD